MPNTCEMLWMIVGMDQRGKCCKKKVHEDEDDEDYDAMTEHEKAMLFPNEADKLPEPDFERFARDVKLRKPYELSESVDSSKPDFMAESNAASIFPSCKPASPKNLAKAANGGP